MYAAIEAARAGCRVLLIDRSLIGRGGATVMAQMTVAVALGDEAPDHWSHHYHDTLTAGRGLCNEPLSRLLCEEGPACIKEMDAWGVGWARKDGKITVGLRAGPRPAALRLCRFPQHRPRRIEDAAHRRPQDAGHHPQGRSLRGRSDARSMARSPARSPGTPRAAQPVVHLGQGHHRRHRRADAALPPQQRLHQHGRRRLCAVLCAPARR